MLEPRKLLGDLLDAKVPGTQSTIGDTAANATDLARRNPLATTALAALLLGTGSGRALTGSVLKIGGLAAVAGLAYQAYKNYQGGKAPAETPTPAIELLPPPSDTAFHHSQTPQSENEFAMTLVRAMIAAAQADGTVDETERQAILDRLRAAGAGEEAEAMLEAELGRPASIGNLIGEARTDAQKVELYTASRLALEVDTPVERSYLQALATRLKLPDNLVRHIESAVESVRA
jgi:uncharacterized membrane protein YebE (DUF533 family)